MIKVTASDILNSSTTLQEIVQKNFPARTAFEIARLAREVNNELTTINESRDAIIKKYAEMDEEGNIKFSEDGRSVRIQQDLLTECSKELNSLSTTEIELNAKKLKLSEFNDADFTPAQLVSIMPFIEEEDE